MGLTGVSHVYKRWYKYVWRTFYKESTLKNGRFGYAFGYAFSLILIEISESE